MNALIFLSLSQIGAGQQFASSAIIFYDVKITGLEL
jgi:hypothetical protein